MANYTNSELITRIQNGLGWDTATDAIKLLICQAITEAGQTAATWRGIPWWWLHTTGSFPTVDGTASYALRTVNEASMSSLYAIERVFFDDENDILPMSWQEYQHWYTTERVSGATGTPTHYVVNGEPPLIHFMPVPDAASTINVAYVMKHRTIVGTDTTGLIVPDEFQGGIYVSGASWILRNRNTDLEALTKCEPFVEAIYRMIDAQPENYTQAPDVDYDDVANGPPADWNLDDITIAGS